MKKSKWLRVWRPRAFALTASGELVYSHQGRELGRVALKSAAVTTPSSCCHSDREFVVRSAGQVLTLRATDADERDTWVCKLNACAFLAARLAESDLHWSQLPRLVRPQTLL
jgi:hypothetical protein